MKATQESRHRWRKMGCVLGLLALVLSVSPAAGQLSPRDSVPAKAVSASPDVPPDWWSLVQKDIAQQEYQLTWQEKACIDGLGPAWQAPNRAQNLRTYFTEQGPRVVRRTDSDPTWVWGLELTGYAMEGSLSLRERVGVREDVPPAVTDTITDGNRIKFHRGDLVEWYVNEHRGLEQGFTIASAPSPLPVFRRTTDLGEGWGEGEIYLSLAVRGNLTPRMMPDGETIEFLSEGGVGLIHYGELRAWDADGKDLPASMHLASGADPPAIRHSEFVIRISVDASDATYPVTIDPLATSPGWTAESDQAGAWFGVSVSTAGDVNGDGYSDVIVGAPFYDNGQNGEGRAFVYHGSASGLSTAAAWTAESDQASAWFGVSVATAGDVNGNGYSDVIVGAHGYEHGEQDEGRAYVYHGSASGLSAQAAWIAESDQAGAWFGVSVSTAGDVNGDGYSDVVVGAPVYTNGEAAEGRAFIYDGSPSGLSSSASWTGESDQAEAFFGFSVSTAGDVNGDGYSDVIVGAFAYDNGETNEGGAFVYHGSAVGVSPSADWTAESDQEDAGLGCSVSTAGDVNGDGYADVVVGVPYYQNGETSEGRAYVYHGSPSGLAAVADWSAESDQARAWFGQSVSTAGDVNGDGYADVIIGAEVYENGQPNEGRGFVYYGSALGLLSVPGWTAESDQEGAGFGGSASTAGDVNGDGYSDVIVGAYRYDNGETDEGRAFVYHGSASGLSTTSAWSADSNHDFAGLGYSVSSAGDVNADGYSDVIVGAPYYDNGEVHEGRAYVYHGSASGPSAAAAWTAQSGQSHARLGWSVSAAGDVNGDGYSDVIVGAPYYDNGEEDEGRAYVYHGSASGLSTAAAWTAQSGQLSGWFGSSVSTAGDVNGDGYSDVIVGAYGYDHGYQNVGRAFVYHGSASGLSAAADWIAESNRAGAEFGWSVAMAGDVNGDGYSDVIVGARLYGGGEGREGRAYVYHGSRSGLSAIAAWTTESNQESAQLGRSVSTAGDVNGDGYSDIIVGVPGYDNDQQDEGRALLYHGSPSGLSTAADWTAESDQSNGQLGHSVATAGDVNGDGYSDVIVGAAFYDHGQPGDGRAYLYHGSASGLSAQPAWIAESDQAGAWFGGSVSTAGDVNGDGYADVIVGAYLYDKGRIDEGAVFLYYGNGETGGGLAMVPTQLRTDGSMPIQPMCLSDSSEGIRISLLGRTPFGRGKVKLEVECKPLGMPFDATGTGISADWVDSDVAGKILWEVLSGLSHSTVYRWRARIFYHPVTTPFQKYSRWFTPAWNAAEEGDFRTAPEPSTPTPTETPTRTPTQAPTLTATPTLSTGTGPAGWRIY